MPEPELFELRRIVKNLRAQGHDPAAIARILRTEHRVNGFSAARLARGWSQRRAHDESRRRRPHDPIPQKTFGSWERWLRNAIAAQRDGGPRPPNKRRPSVDSIERLAEFYECSVSELLEGWADFSSLVAGSTSDHGYPPDVDRRTALRVLGAAGAAAVTTTNALVIAGAPVSANVGPTDVARLRSDIEALSLLEQRVGGGGVYRRSLALLERVEGLLKQASYKPSIGRQVRSLLGRLHRDLGWAAFDTGRHDLARYHYGEALSAATIAADQHLQVFVLEGMAHQSWALGDARTSLAQAEAALHDARHFASDRLLSLLTTSIGMAHGLAGDRAAVAAAFATAERLYESHDVSLDPDWLLYYSPSAFGISLAVAHLQMGDPVRAEAIAKENLRRPGFERFPRDKASSMAWLAAVLIDRGSIDEAAAVAVETVNLLGGGIASPRVGNRLKALVPTFERHPNVEGASLALDLVEGLLRTPGPQL